MLGAYFGFQISQYFGFWTGLILAPVLVGLIGALVERFGLRTVHKWGHVPELLFTFGLAFVIEELVKMVWGKLPVDYQVPRSEEHTSELQSLMRISYAVFCLKKKKHKPQNPASTAIRMSSYLM